MNSKLDEDLNKLSEDYLSSQSAAINVLYVEMDCFQDYRLGALLCMITNEEDYKYVLSNIDNYNTRVSKKVMEYFPKLDITDNEIAAYIADTNNHSRLANISPMTDYYKYFNKFSTVVESNNKLSPEASIPTLYLAMPTVKLPATYKKQLIDSLQFHLRGWNIQYTTTGIKDYCEILMQSIKHFTIYDIEDVLKDEGIQKLLEQGKVLADSSVHAFPLITTTDNIELSNEQLFENTELILGMVCDFKYVTMRVTQEQGK